MSNTSESSPLLSKPPQEQKQQKYRSCNFKYRLPLITEKGAIVMIVCNMLALTAGIAQLLRIFLMHSTTLSLVLMVVIIFPVVGIVAGTRIQRFKFIETSIVFLLASSLLNILRILFKDYLPPTAEAVFVMCTAGLICIGSSCYLACAFPFTADQMIGASGEQLSFAVYWMSWGVGIANYPTLLPSIIPSDYLDIAFEAVSFFNISIAAFLVTHFKHLLTILPQHFNPYKLIFRVLNYARMHKYPERRSALTYWEEDIPSRIDLGMSKYGGPFTVEEVEDVKTFFRLLPVIICAGGDKTGLIISWDKLFGNEGLFPGPELDFFYSYLFLLLLLTLGIPIYHFLLYPLFYNYIPTMFNRIRFGLVLVICSHCMSAVVGDLLVCNSLTNTTCLLFHSKMFNVSSNGGWWITIPATVYNTGLLLSTITIFEFVCAQSPRPLCGLLTTITIMSPALSSSIGYGVYEVLSTLIPPTHSQFYSNLSIAFIVFVYFLLFHSLSKRYKWRKRDDIVPIHLFAEEYFEKELRGQKRLEKERSSWQRRMNVVD